MSYSASYYTQQRSIRKLQCAAATLLGFLAISISVIAYYRETAIMYEARAEEIQNNCVMYKK